MTNNWTQDPRFYHFWENYNKGQSWYYKHQVSFWRSKAVAISYENSFLHWLMQSSAKHCRQSASYQQVITEVSPLPNQIEHDPLHSEEIEMEITGDMLEFIAHSMKHKKERNDRDVGQEVTYINVDEIPVEKIASDIHVNIHNSSNENQDYNDLYGVNAPKIHAMETAVQLNFNRNCDRKHPKLWPNMPLCL